MSGKVFLDSNVLAYAQDRGSPVKRRKSRRLIEQAAASGNGVISTQIMQEFYVTITRKMGVPPLAAKGVLKSFAMFELVPVSSQLIYDAIDCSILNTLSFWDALVLSAASSAGCSTLYSEDLNPGQKILGITIENPFV